MKTFEVMLTRTYKVTVEAEDEKSAKEIAEYFIGEPEDKSLERERLVYKFNIQEIELMLNEAYEAEEVED